MDKYELKYWNGLGGHYHEDETDYIEINGEEIEQRDKRIITEFVKRVQSKIDEAAKEPQYQHEGEDWISGLFMASDKIQEVFMAVFNKSKNV